MSQNKLAKPVFVILYGLPGSGKSTFARQLSELIGIAHVSSDRIRYELFDNPSYSQEENEVVQRIMDLLAEQFLQAGISIIYDINASKLQERRALRDMARKLKAEPMLLWFQIDTESAFARAKARDPKKPNDKYTVAIDRDTFDRLSKDMQNPYMNETFIVMSGKHLFGTQKQVVLRKLYDMGLMDDESLKPKIAKPELVNLVTRAAMNAGRADLSRRNINIR